MNKKLALTFSATVFFFPPLRTIEVKLLNVQIQLGSYNSVQYHSSLCSEINPQQIEDLEVSSSPLQDCPHLSQLKEKAAGEDLHELVPKGRGSRGDGSVRGESKDWKLKASM